MLDKCGFWAGEVSRGAYLALVVFASFAYGLTRQEGIDFFNVAMGGTVVLWLISCVLSSRWPATGLWPWLISAGLLLLAWALTLLGLAEERYVNSDMEIPEAWIDVILAFGSYDAALALAASIRTSALLGSMLMAIDLFSRPAWTRALLLTLGLTGLVMVLFFFLQKIVGGPFLLSSIDGSVYLSFATFRYHGNAASYLNLLWPLLAALAIHLLRRQALGWMFWTAAALFGFAAVFVNIAKAGHLLAPGGMVLFLAIVGIQMARGGRRHFTIPSPAVLIAVAIPLAVIVASLYFAIPWDRWQYLKDTDFDHNARPVAYRYFVTMLPDAGWQGFGPGSFQLAYWQYIDRADPIMQHTPYWVAHQDYIQTVVEWGYAGTILWGLLFVIPAVRLGISSFRPPSGDESDDDGYLFSIADRFRAFVHATPGAEEPLLHAAAFAAIIMTALHSLIDFPMQIASIQFYFLIWIALGWHLMRRRRHRIRVDPEAD